MFVHTGLYVRFAVQDEKAGVPEALEAGSFGILEAAAANPKAVRADRPKVEGHVEKVDMKTGDVTITYKGYLKLAKPITYEREIRTGKNAGTKTPSTIHGAEIVSIPCTIGGKTVSFNPGKGWLGIRVG